MPNYETIHLDDYVRTGEGGTAVSYTHKTRNILAKLYNPGFEADRAEDEFLTARTVFELGLPTPEPLRLVTDGERYGAEYELVKNKRSFTRIISEEPQRLEEMSVAFARMARQLHATEADTSRLRPYKQVLTAFYREKNLVTDAYRERALRFLETAPEATTCLHCDLHIGNIITDGERTLWIDVGEFSYGVPEWDLGLMWSICNNMNAERVENLFHLQPEQLRAHWNIFLSAYLGTTDPQVLGQYVKHLMPFYAVKVPYVFDMAFHTPFPAEACEKLVGLMEAPSAQ